jgi:hypothetical protein
MCFAANRKCQAEDDNIIRGGSMKLRTVTAVFTLAVLMAALAASAGATLLDIGTATYGSNNYKLIYETGGPGGPVVWLDYTNATNTWSNQVAWANSLNTTGTLTYNLLSGYSMDWSTGSGSGWQLPTTVDSSSSYAYPPPANSSQLAYLYYTDLVNTTSGLVNTGPFDNLQNNPYWSGTEFSFSPGRAWVFFTDDGNQNGEFKDSYGPLGLATRPGQLETAPVPEPSTMLLLGIGLAGLAGWRKRRRGF